MNEPRISLLRVAPLASASGRYGGPFDTSVAQAGLFADDPNWKVRVFAGHLANDSVDSGMLSVELISPRLRRALPRFGFHFTWSGAAARTFHSAVRGADVAHVSVARELFPLFTLWAATRSRARVIAQPHGMLTSRSSLLHRLVDLVVRPLVKRADAIIALTQTEADALRDWFGTAEHPEIRVVGNPSIVNHPEILMAESPEREGALFLARLHSRKHVDVFVRAARIAAAQGWEDQYAIVGPDQGDLAIVQAAVSELANLSYEGFLAGSQVGARLARAKVFVLPSAAEPWGNVLVAAMLLGVPSILTQSSALAHVVATNGLGHSVKDGDAEAIAAHVHGLLELAPDEYKARTQDISSRAHVLFSKTSIRASLGEIYGLQP